jgi:hypothetical protein
MNNLHIFINNFRKHERDGREKVQSGKGAKWQRCKGAKKNENSNHS